MRIAVAVPASVVLALLAVQAWRLGASGETVYRAADEMATWSASRHEPDAAGVEWLIADLEAARLQAPGDPNVEELLGTLAMKRTDRPGFLDEALGHFRAAVELRPSSPYAWAEVVAAQYREGDTKGSIEAAMRNAARLGPAEPEVQRTVVDYGLALWDEEAPETRRAVETAVTGAMMRDPAETLHIAERRDRLAVACRHLADASRRVDPEWRLLCSSRGEPS
ncbi:MAG TPA: hypothetical protein VN598_09280 [Usitatibacter sp.]|nr:hypothetical protein [Usitatibacter sp.]